MPVDISKPLDASELAALGFQRISRGDAIRAKCLDCAGSSNEVRACEVGTCALWPFRLGTDPWREVRVMTDEQKAAAVERLARARLASAPLR